MVVRSASRCRIDLISAKEWVQLQPWRFCHDGCKLRSVEGAKGLSVDITQRGQGKHHPRCCFIVLSIKDDDSVVSAEGPVKLTNFDARFLGGGFELGGAMRGFVDILKPLRSEIDEGDVGGHGDLDWLCS